jgi:phenylpropionate dioxygenase-like ring-hydroxylating dioxygenase large terminal subunit
MIRNQWYVVLESKNVPKEKAVGVTRLGEKLVFWRTLAGKVVCMHDLCPHLGASLSQGAVKGETLACPFHGFEYDRSGTCTLIPAISRSGAIPKAMRAGTYATYEAHELIWMYWGEAQENLPEPQFFASFNLNSSYKSFKQHWGVHYSRMIENQLDVMHLPFVHHNTIGRGVRAVVDGPYVKLEDGLMKIWVYNRLDDGITGRKMEDLQPPTRHPFLEFRFPNIWHNWISDSLHIFVAFVPVDEENGIFIGRYYQNMVRLPLLRELMNLVGVWSSIVIANQDKRVVEKILPKKSALKKMGNKLVPGDRAILMYRTHRQELKEAAGQIED